MDLKQQRAELAALANTARGLHAQIEAAGEQATAEDKAKLATLLADGQKKRQALDLALGVAELTALTGGDGAKAQENILSRRAHKTWGELFTGSEQYKDLIARKATEMSPVLVGALPIARKALYGQVEGEEGAGGYLVAPDRQADIIDLARQQPRTIASMVNQARTSSDSVEYFALVTRTNNAAETPQRTAGAFTAKPESNLVFVKDSTLVKTIATWIPASRQILADVPRLQDTVNGELIYMVEIRMDQQILVGDGIGDNLLGINNVNGVQLRTHQSAGRAFVSTDTLADTLRRAITDIYLAFYQPDGIVLHPTQGEALELEKDNNGQYLKVYDSATMKVWRVPVVETATQTSGTATVGAYRLGATLWDREATEVRYSENYSDYFVRNAVVLLAELRAAFAVTRPLAFEVVDGLDA